MLYDDVCVSILSETDDHLNYASNTKFIRKKFKHFKTYWSDDLTSHWKDMTESEKRYTRCPHNSHQKSQLWNEFIHRRNSFDKLLRQTKREYNKNIAEQIESISDKDPMQFWEQIKKLGLQRNKQIPMQVYDDHGAVECDRDEVWNEWKNDFKNLYNMPEDATSEFE